MSLFRLRKALSYPKTTWQLSLLAVVSGICAACVIVLFRLAFESIQLYMLGEIGVYAHLTWYERFALPFLGVIGIFCIAYLTGFEHYRLGIPYVLHRVKTEYGIIPWRTTINQFFGGIFALASGFFVGREGPSVHLGAAGTSFIGQGLKLPFNSIRILSGCGIAAGIAASFNTPLAAVLFVMEVILREYRIHVFIPVMLSAAVGSVISRAVFGDGTALLFLNFAPIDDWMYSYLVLFGCLLGALASLFNRQLMAIMRAGQKRSLWSRFLIAACITGTIGIAVPEAMGAEFNQISQLFTSAQGLLFLLVIICAKFILGSVAIGLGIPGGIIGPVMIIGIYFGAIAATLLSIINGTEQYMDTFMLLGLAGMLTSVIHAPLAALSAVVELSYAPDIVLPAILVIVPSYIVSSQLFNNRSIFISQLEFLGMSYQQSAITQSLQKTGVMALMQPVNDSSLSLSNNSSLPRFTYQATLSEVYDVLKVSRSGSVLIIDPAQIKPIGVIDWEDLHSYLFKQQY